MKKLLLILSAVALALLAFTPPACADTGVEPVISAGTFTNAATRTSGFTAIEVSKQVQCGVVLRFTGSGTNAVDNLIVTFGRSANGTNIETVPRWTWSVPLNATTAVVGYTNLNADALGAARYLHVISVENTGNASATNAYIEVIKKTIKPSP